MSWREIPGWFGFSQTYDRFIEMAQDGDAFVEIGVAFGRSIAYLAEGLHSRGKRCQVYAVDPWIDDRWEFPADYPQEAPRPGWGGEYAEMARGQGGPFSSFVRQMLTHSPTSLEYIKVLRTTSALASRMIGPCKGVLIDGSHEYEAVAQDIAIWLPHVVPGGILAGDDYHEGDFPGVCKAVRERFGANYRIEGEKDTTWMVRR